MVGGVKAEKCESGLFIQNPDGTQYTCETYLGTALNKAKEGETIVLLDKTLTPKQDITIEKDIIFMVRTHANMREAN